MPIGELAAGLLQQSAKGMIAGQPRNVRGLPQLFPERLCERPQQLVLILLGLTARRIDEGESRIRSIMSKSLNNQ